MDKPVTKANIQAHSWRANLYNVRKYKEVSEYNKGSKVEAPAKRWISDRKRISNQIMDKPSF